MIRGQVIDREKNDKGRTIITLIGLDEAVNKNDKAKLLHLQDVKRVCYRIEAYEMVENRKHTIGALSRIKPVAEVLMALTNLE